MVMDFVSSECKLQSTSTVYHIVRKFRSTKFLQIPQKFQFVKI